MREIGSEFWEVPTEKKNDDLFPESTQWFLSGRSALYAIIHELGSIKSVSLPSWCCESMIKPFVKAGIKIFFYPVYWQDGLIQEIDLSNDALFIMDYFGYSSQPLPDLNGYKGAVIRDVTHSFFSITHTDADYYFGSLRKWCGVWTGGYAWSKDGRRLCVENCDDLGYVSLRKSAMNLKNCYIHEHRSTNKGYLTIFHEAEERLEKIGIAPAADRDVQAIRRLDIHQIKSVRRKNAQILRSAFPDWNVFPQMNDSDCPMFVPVFVPGGKRDELRRYLVRHEIYCPVHWPVSGYHKFDDRTEYIYENELSLVCDQRYSEEDMFRMIEVINAFWKVA